MELTTERKLALRPHRAARIVAVTMMLFGVSSLLFAPDAARAATAHGTKHIVIATATNSKFGTILVSRTTLYTLKPNATACATTCLKYWPEVLLAKGVMTATAGKGVDASKLGTVKRAGGRLQVTYAGKALYWFAGDTAAGQVKGNVTDTWGRWSVVVTKRRSAAVTTTKGGGVTTTTTASSGGGVGF